ncbi:Conserved_hypothetical protein [Hexamita inflata]|uniref:Uncharacterized protein n=1 Tax=Hexamita inflata TaxID=28002 RepID=A0AA86QYN6_9EUKA|nr:Conserved hypothetical protein [Hexamita inflata]
MINIFASLQITCFQPYSNFVYDGLKKQGTLTVTPLVFKDDNQFRLCRTLHELTFQAYITTQHGFVLESTLISYDTNKSYQIAVSCSGDAATQLLCQNSAKTSQQAVFDLQFKGVDTKITQTIASYNVNIYNHNSCILSGAISFKSAEQKLTFTGTRSGCDLSDTMVNDPAATDSAAVMELSIYDGITNETKMISKNILTELLATVNHHLVVVFDCSLMGAQCVQVFNVFDSTKTYTVSANVKYLTFQRPYDHKQYYLHQIVNINNIVSLNYPSCYQEIYATIQQTGVSLILNRNVNIQCTIPAQTRTYQINVGITGTTTKYIIQKNQSDFSFSESEVVIKCQTEECLNQLKILAEDLQTTIVYQITFLDQSDNQIDYYMSTAQQPPKCVTQLTAQVSDAQLCLTPTVIIDISTCDLLIPKRIPLHVRMYSGSDQILNLQAFDVFNIQKQFCLPCPECASLGSQIDQLQSGVDAKSLVSIQNQYYYIDSFSVTKTVESEWVAASICFGMLAISIIIIIVVYIKM